MQRYRAVKFRVCDKDLIRLTVFHPWSRWRLLDTNKQTNKHQLDIQQTIYIDYPSPIHNNSWDISNKYDISVKREVDLHLASLKTGLLPKNGLMNGGKNFHCILLCDCYRQYNFISHK